MTMKEKYQALYKKQEYLRVQLIADLQPYSEEILHTRLTPDSWSVSDIIAHMIAGDEYVFSYISKKVKEKGYAAPSGALAKAKHVILKIAFFFPFKFKAPKATIPSTEYATLPELTAKWEKTAIGTNLLLNSLDESEFHKDIWKHPRVGKINFVQMADFALDHSNRHVTQIKKLLADLKV
jgi:DinB superfamily